MRTAGVLQMDTPLPDGRILFRPQDFFNGGTLAVTGANQPVYNITGSAPLVIGSAPGLLLRYGMSDDAQQQFGKGSPSGGYQGAQAQAVSTLTPFTTPYGPTGRPPYSNVSQLLQPNGRPKGLKPTAVTVAYSVTGGALTSAQVALVKTPFNVGSVPTNVAILPNANLPLSVATMQLITTPIIAANQSFLADPFDTLTVFLTINAGANTMAVYGVYIDVAFNYN